MAYITGNNGSIILNVIKILASIITFVLTKMFGGLTLTFKLLLVMIVVDIVLGVLKGVKKCSDKSENGTLSSESYFNGMIKKGVMLLIIFLAYQIDVAFTGGTSLRDATCIFYVVGELGSIIENVGLLGVPLPSALKNMFEVLKEKTEGE